MMGQDPTEMIHQLSSTLVDEDNVIVKESLHMTERILKSKASSQKFHPIVCHSQPMLHALVNATLKSFTILSNPAGESQQALEEAVERAQRSTTILRMLAEPQKDVPASDQRNRNQFAACKGIIDNHGAHALTILLPYENARIRNNCLVTIHTLLTYDGLRFEKQLYDTVKRHIREADGPKSMMTQLKNISNEKYSAILCDCLSNLAKLDKPTKDVIRQHQGIECLLRILGNQQYYNLIEKTMNLLQIVSTDGACKQLINQNHGTDVIAFKMLQFLEQRQGEHHKILYYAASAMRNISDAVEQLKDEDMVMRSLLETLRSPPISWQAKVLNCVLGTLGNLLVKIPTFKLKMLTNNGMMLLVDIMIKCKQLIHQNLAPTSGNREALNLIEPVLLAIK